MSLLNFGRGASVLWNAPPGGVAGAMSKHTLKPCSHPIQLWENLLSSGISYMSSYWLESEGHWWERFTHNWNLADLNEMNAHLIKLSGGRWLNHARSCWVCQRLSALEPTEWQWTSHSPMFLDTFSYKTLPRRDPVQLPRDTVGSGFQVSALFFSHCCAAPTAVISRTTSRDICLPWKTHGHWYFGASVLPHARVLR